MVLSVASLRKQFGDATVLEDVSFRIGPREKVALVGRNGTGKTTLLKILAGELEPDGGSVSFARGARVGYLRQELPVDHGLTVLEEAQAGRAEALSMAERLKELEARLADGATPDDLEEYATLHERFLEAQGYAAENDVRLVLARMGFDECEFDKPTSALSGGEKTRLALARLLLEEPDLLILDEPTNHLDFDSREALAKALAETTGTLILVSHDRHLLDSVTDHTLDLRVDGHTLYPGRYAEYRLARARAEAETQRGPRPEPRSGGEDRPWNPRALSKEVSRLEKELAAAEDRVAELESELAALESTLADPPTGADLLELTSRHGGLQDEIARALAYWEQIGSELERLRAMQGGAR